MNNSSLDKESSNNKTQKKRFSKSTSFIIWGAVIAVLIGVGTLVFSGSSTIVEAQEKPQPTSKGNKKYIATMNIIVDRATGRMRKPNDKELKELVETLKNMTKRSDENLQTTSLSNGGVGLNLEEGFAGTMLSKPKADGTFETRCVFTFEEAAAFLGLVEDNSTE